MKKRILFTLLFSLIFGIVLMAQTQDSTISGGLQFFGVSKTLAWIIGSIITFVVTKWFPQKWVDPLVWAEKIAFGLGMVLHGINMLNQQSAKQKKAIAKFPRQTYGDKWKYFMQLSVLFGLLTVFCIPAGAQVNGGHWFGKIRPGDIIGANVKEKGIKVDSAFKTHAIFFKLTTGVTGPEFRLVSGDIDKQLFDAIGAGPTLGFYKLMDKGLPTEYVKNTINLSLLLYTPLQNPGANLSAGLIASVPIQESKTNGGVGIRYDFKAGVLWIGPQVTINW